MSVTVSYASTLTVSEILATNVADMSDKTVVHSGYNSSGTYNAASSPPSTTVAAFEQALSSGTATIDLRALLGTNNIAVDGNGLRAQFIKFRNKSTNANPITIAKGASNGYDGLGAAFSIALAVGAEFLMKLNDGGNDIGATNKTLDLTGTGAQVLECEIVMG